jgi:hypothetical protein
MLTRDYIRKTYNVTSDGIIRSPGKFEGEPLYTPYFWSLMLDGGGDEEDGDDVIFQITDEDRRLYPELGSITRLALREDENGFVYSTVIGSANERYCAAIPAELMVE